MTLIDRPPTRIRAHGPSGFRIHGPSGLRAHGPSGFRAVAALFALAGTLFSGAALAQDTHRPRVMLDGRDLTESVYDEPPIDIAPDLIPNYRATMRDIINKLAEYAHSRDPEFQILIRNGAFLATQGKRERDLAILKIPPGEPFSQEALMPLGALHRRFARNVDGFAIDRRYCDPNSTLDEETFSMLQREGFFFMALEPCADAKAAGEAEAAGWKQGVRVATTTTPDGVFSEVPRGAPPRENPGNVVTPDQARNILAVLDTRNYDRAEDWVTALSRTNHDLLVVDPFFNGNQALTKDQVYRLGFKALGSKRLVLARLTIGLAEDVRYYWKPEWDVGNPPWVVGFVPEAPGVFWITFDHPEWLAIVGKAFAALMDLGYDGVLLDGVTAIYRDEALMPM